jgi:hypothetical protein
MSLSKSFAKESMVSFRKYILLVFPGFLFCFTIQAQNEAVLKGKVLAESYCGACHAFPSPSLLPNEIWKNKVLPQMAAFMGFKEAQDSLGVWEKTEVEIIQLKRLGVYPPSPQLSSDDFQSISAYYGAESPKQLPDQTAKAKPETLPNFLVKKLFINGIQSPKTSLVAIHEGRSELFIADASSNQLYVKDQFDELYTLPPTTSPAVHFLLKEPNVFNFITIGSIAPNDLSEGALYEMDLNADAWNKVIDQLARPVYGTWKDIENDGKPDLLLCNYGNNGGNIFLYKDGNFQANPIQLGGAGARKIEVADLNKDGKLDIIALFCQGDERISVFYNREMDNSILKKFYSDSLP